MDGWTATMRVLLGTVVVALLAASPAVARAPVGEWRFDEGAGVVAHDSSGSALDGLLRGGTSWVPGLQGTALHFDGDDEVALPDGAALEPAQITVAAWVRNLGSPGSHRYVLSKGSRSCWSSSYGLYTGAAGGAAFYVSGAGAYTVSPQADPAQVWDGRWHRLAGSYDGERVRLYLDGKQVGTGTEDHDGISYGLASRAPYIGTYHGDCDLPYTGDVDVLRVWKAALTPAEMAQDAVVPVAATQPAGPVAPLTFVPHVIAPGTRTATSCASLTLSRHSVRVGRRAHIVATVRSGGRRLKRARVEFKTRRLQVRTRTDGKGRARLTIRAKRSQHRLRVRTVVHKRACGTATEYVLVKR